jgi:hypothetical protein
MGGLRPFWRYYGGKWRNAPHYPAPIHDTIVEPFAGAAGYSLRYPDRRVILVDRNPIIAGIWRYLIAVSADEVRRLPDIPDGGTVDDIDAPQEARWLAGFWCNSAVVQPCKRPSKWALRGADTPHWGGWNHRSRERIASQVDRIRHWRIIEGEYHDAPDIVATWHVDPPYQGRAGRHYPHQPADFDALGDWCQTRRGQVMVCEQEGADWLPFRPLGSFRSTPGAGKAARSAEVIWTNGDVQQTLDL